MAKKNSDFVPIKDRPTVDLVRSDYQPSKAELEQDMRIDVTPDALAKAIVSPINIRYSRRPKDRR